MNKLVILCVEDEAEVRDAVMRDCNVFQPLVRIEAAENADDARMVLHECREAGEKVAVVLCDHLMPGVRGVDFLIALDKDPEHQDTRKVLITGQAGLEDTVRAVNEAHLNHYIAKPWKAEALQEVVRNELTEYVLATQDNLIPFVPVCDGPRLLETMAARGSAS